MRTTGRRLRLLAAAITAGALASAGIIAGTSLADAGKPATPARSAASSPAAAGNTIAPTASSRAMAGHGPARPVSGAPAGRPAGLINCRDNAVVRPGQFVLTCADGNDYLTGLHWVSWRDAAFGSGLEHVNDCLPDCADGHTFSYPVLVTLWRPEARPGHPGQKYFSRLTEIHTGALHKAPGSTLPRTQTWKLRAAIG